MHTSNNPRGHELVLIESETPESNQPEFNFHRKGDCGRMFCMHTHVVVNPEYKSVTHRTNFMACLSGKDNDYAGDWYPVGSGMESPQCIKCLSDTCQKVSELGGTREILFGIPTTVGSETDVVNIEQFADGVNKVNFSTIGTRTGRFPCDKPNPCIHPNKGRYG